MRCRRTAASTFQLGDVLRIELTKARRTSLRIEVEDRASEPNRRVEWNAERGAGLVTPLPIYRLTHPAASTRSINA